MRKCVLLAGFAAILAAPGPAAAGTLGRVQSATVRDDSRVLPAVVMFGFAILRQRMLDTLVEQISAQASRSPPAGWVET